VRSTMPPDRRVHALSSWPRLLLAIVVGAGMVAACSGGGGTAAPASGEPAATSPAQSAAPDATQAPAGGDTVDVCAMLSAADLKTITGKDATGAAEDKSNWDDWAAGQCSWSPSDGSGTIPLMVQVGTPASIAKSTEPTAQEHFDLTKMAIGAEEVPGLGDAAASSGGLLFIRKGGSFVLLNSVGFPKDKDQLVAIAKLLLAKL